jgi:hypothetical protein
VYKATVDALSFLSVGDIVQILDFDTDLTEADIQGLNTLERLVEAGLRRAGVLVEDGDEYTKRQLEEGLEEVRVSMTRGVQQSPFREDILAIITRAMNEG